MRRGTILLLTGLLLLAVVAGCSKSEKVIKSLEDAKNARIGAMTGTTGEAMARARFPEAPVKSFDDIMDAVAAIKSGQLDVIVTSYPTALQVVKKNPELWLLPEPLDNEDISIAIRKGNDEMLALLNRTITELKADGTLADMKKRWFKDDLSPYMEMDLTVPKDGPVLKVGVTATREPMNFVDQNGRVTGHDGELARIIGIKLRRPIEFFNMKFMALIPALQSGKIDLIVSGMTATDERRRSVDFTQPYFADAQVMLVKKSSKHLDAPAKLASPADLKDKQIGVLLGSAHDTFATKNYPQATILQYKSPSDLVVAVKTGKVDAALYDSEPLRVILRQDNELGVLGGPLLSFPIGAGFSKDSAGLREQFNTFLRKIKQDGTYNDMVERWMNKGDTQMPEIPAARTNGTLVVGVVGNVGFPFTSVNNNKLVGFDIELSKRFAAYLGREARLADMEFGGLIAAVSTHKIDMIASSMFITEERKKQIIFSDPYYEMATNAFALKKNLSASDAESSGEKSGPSFFGRLANSFYSNLILENRYLLIWDGLKTTVVISIFATLVGTLLGALVCFMRMSNVPLLNAPARVYISILRGTPVLVLLMLVFYVVFASVNISPVLVSVIAFGMNFAAYTAEIFRTGIEGVDKGQTEAGIAMGFTRIRTFQYIVLPQTIQRILPVYKGEFISLVKMTSVVGYIAVQDLTKASDIVRSRTFDAFFPLVMVAVLYFAISWLLMQSLEYLERRTDPKLRRKKAGAA